eukprot:m.66128 g.66128  ORF g.66128 m.66128 type:complete len:92 (-) comp12102_c0_seq2:120-395(-)
MGALAVLLCWEYGAGVVVTDCEGKGSGGREGCGTTGKGLVDSYHHKDMDHNKKNVNRHTNENRRSIRAKIAGVCDIAQAKYSLISQRCLDF